MSDAVALPENELHLFVLDACNTATVVTLARRGLDLAVQQLPCTGLAALNGFRERIDRAIRGAETRPTADELTEFGHKLFSFLIHDQVRDLYAGLPRDDAVRIHILSNQSDVQALPWEFLQEPGRAFGKGQRSIIRIVPTLGIRLHDPKPLEGKVRILFVSADPLDQGQVDWPTVKSSIERTFSVELASRMATGSFEFDAIEGASFKTLIDQLLAKRYDILHFSGHGEVRDEKGYLLFHNRRTQKSSPVGAERLCDHWSGRGLRLVVLSGCDTARGNFSREFAVIAETLIKAGVPAVVASQFALPNSMVATFVGPFYATLLRTGDVDLAMIDGRASLAALDLGSRTAAVLEWGIPVLYRHFAAARVFQP